MGRGGPKFYAIRRGRDGYRGVATTWTECQKYVNQVSGAVFKSFPTRREAEEFAGVGPAVSRGITKEPSSSKSVAGKAKRKNATALRRGAKRFLSSETAVSQSAKDASVLTVYTDGACVGNGKSSAKAGYGVFFGENHELNVSKRLPGNPQTNQRAEMMAVLVAIRIVLREQLCPEGKSFLIKTDSQYTLNGYNSWIQGWKKKGWITTAGTPVKNYDLWKQLDEVKQDLSKKNIGLSLEWVKGHAGSPGNEAADRLAVRGINDVWTES